MIRHSRKPDDTRKLHDSVFSAIEVLHCGNRDFLPFSSRDLDLDPMTFIYELDPHSLQIHRMWKYQLPTSRPSKYHLTYRHDQNYIEAYRLAVILSNYISLYAEIVCPSFEAACCLAVTTCQNLIGSRACRLVTPL